MRPLRAEAAFAYFGGRCDELLYDRMRTVVLGSGKDAAGKPRLNATFAAFAGHWGVTVRLCQPYRAQTKGKVGSGLKYLRRPYSRRLQPPLAPRNTRGNRRGRAPGPAPLLSPPTTPAFSQRTRPPLCGSAGLRSLAPVVLPRPAGVTAARSALCGARTS